MRRTLFLMSFGIGAMMLAAQQSHAQGSSCAEHSTVVERLAERYGEIRQTIDLARDNSVVEVFASMDTGSWTITVTRPGGQTCLAAAGQAYQYLNEPLANLDNDT
ncbi:hypothetical protein [Loktanella sp. Alg231-35]|uniref:hypothetical protein n=1 Tax=Loktanella sp. Alg231-35 TaxID=1922220 RepID=UPI000D551CF8|nr:hypothetical protein [Loktanella sp. Alg231-35]